MLEEVLFPIKTCLEGGTTKMCLENRKMVYLCTPFFFIVRVWSKFVYQKKIPFFFSQVFLVRCLNLSKLCLIRSKVLGRKEKGLAEGFTEIDPTRYYFPAVQNHRGFESMCVCTNGTQSTLCLFQSKINADHKVELAGTESMVQSQ